MIKPGKQRGHLISYFGVNAFHYMKTKEYLARGWTVFEGTVGLAVDYALNKTLSTEMGLWRGAARTCKILNVRNVKVEWK